jgi:hypothetical protein
MPVVRPQNIYPRIRSLGCSVTAGSELPMKQVRELYGRSIKYELGKCTVRTAHSAVLDVPIR